MRRPDPIDKNNLDGVMGATAVPLEFPEGLSKKAEAGLAYLEGAAFLFQYQGRYIVTDESGWLTAYGTGRKDDPAGFPQAEFESLSEIGPWLEQVANDNAEDDDIPFC